MLITCFQFEIKFLTIFLILGRLTHKTTRRIYFAAGWILIQYMWLKLSDTIFPAFVWENIHASLRKDAW